MARGHVLQSKSVLRSSYSGWQEPHTSDSQTSFPSRLIVHIPSSQLRPIMRENHSPKLHRQPVKVVADQKRQGTWHLEWFAVSTFNSPAATGVVRIVEVAL